jgi:vacuolar-type H+-ATPase subunit I/STV1
MKELEKLMDEIKADALEWREVLLRHKQSEGMREAFRKAASDLAIEEEADESRILADALREVLS